MTPSVRAGIRSFICANFIVSEGAFGDGDSMLEKEIMDSTGILELVAYLEREFGIQVADDEIVPGNLDSIDAITAFLERKRLVTAAVRAGHGAAGEGRP
jgi:acyl carrier protein